MTFWGIVGAVSILCAAGAVAMCWEPGPRAIDLSDQDQGRDDNYRIISAPGRDPETLKYCVTASTAAYCRRGIAAAAEQVSRAGGAAIFAEPRQIGVNRWIADGTAVIFGRSAP